MLAYVAVLALAAFLVLLAVALVVLSFFSYESVKAHLDSFASDGDADITRADFDRIVVRLRIAAALVLLAAVAVYTFRNRLSGFLVGIAASGGSSVASLRRGLRTRIAGESRLHLGALGVVTLAALLVRLEFLFQPMRYDESVTFVHYASRPWYIALTTYTAPNNHVFHSLLVHLSTFLPGGAPWAIRLPAFIAGVLLVPATYVAARALYGKHAALVAASLVAVSSVLVEYSTNARGYTLLALVFVLLVALAAHLQSSWNPADWLAFAVLGAIGFYTVPVMLYAFGAVVVWLALSLWPRDRALITRRLLPSVLTTAVLTLLVYAPVVASSGIDALVANEFVQSLSWSTFTSELPDSLAALAEQWHRDVPLPIALVLAAGFLTAIAFHRRLSPFAISPALAALAWVAPVLVIQRVVPFERVWLFLVPLYLLSAAAGIVFLLRPLTARIGGERTLAAVIAVVVAVSLGASAVASQSVYASEDTSTFRDGPQVAALLADRLRTDDKVLVAPPADAILEYQLGRRGLDAAELLYWARPGDSARFLAVVKEAPENYTLEQLLADPRLEPISLGEPRLLRRYDAAAIYELERAP
ncbi:MAG: glycosyltransferase family 39 protein [Gaiellaceae bacterium]